MRIITVFNENSNSKDLLNIAANLARSSKRVLYIDLRIFKTKSKKKSIGLNIKSILKSNNSKNIGKYIVSLERNLEIIKSSEKLNETEFSSYDSLFKSNAFSEILSGLKYDYIFFEVTPILSLLTLNSLNVSSEIMAFENLDSEPTFSYSIVHFLKHFNFLYEKKILLTKIITKYSNSLNKRRYVKLVSDFSSSLVSFPLYVGKRNSQFKESLLEISKDIIFQEKYLEGTLDKRIQFEQDIFLLLDRISQE